MNTMIAQFEVLSPDGLRKALAGHERNGACFAGVRVFGQNILTRQFNFPNSSTEDLIAGLKLEASEILSVAALEVELSYQITGKDTQGMRGIFSAMPRHLLMEYLECFKGHSLVPVSLTASAVGAVIDFSKDQGLPGGNFCLVNFLKPQSAGVIIFADAMPTLFRELYDLSDSDFKDKIKDTIRYSCSHSAIKSMDHIFFTGDLKGKDALIKSLKELEHPDSVQTVPAGNRGQFNFSGLNLWGKHVCGLAESTRLIFIFSLVSAIFVSGGVFLAWHFVNGNVKLHEARSKINEGQYNQALELQEQVRRINHVS